MLLVSFTFLTSSFRGRRCSRILAGFVRAVFIPFCPGSSSLCRAIREPRRKPLVINCLFSIFNWACDKDLLICSKWHWTVFKRAFQKSFPNSQGNGRQIGLHLLGTVACKPSIVEEARFWSRKGGKTVDSPPYAPRLLITRMRRSISKHDPVSQPQVFFRFVLGLTLRNLSDNGK